MYFCGFKLLSIIHSNVTVESGIREVEVSNSACRKLGLWCWETPSVVPAWNKTRRLCWLVISRKKSIIFIVIMIIAMQYGITREEKRGSSIWYTPKIFWKTNIFFSLTLTRGVENVSFSEHFPHVLFLKIWGCD